MEKNNSLLTVLDFLLSWSCTACSTFMFFFSQFSNFWASLLSFLQLSLASVHHQFFYSQVLLPVMDVLPIQILLLLLLGLHGLWLLHDGCRLWGLHDGPRLWGLHNGPRLQGLHNRLLVHWLLWVEGHLEIPRKWSCSRNWNPTHLRGHGIVSLRVDKSLLLCLLWFLGSRKKTSPWHPDLAFCRTCNCVSHMVSHTLVNFLLFKLTKIWQILHMWHLWIKVSLQASILHLLLVLSSLKCISLLVSLSVKCLSVKFKCLSALAAMAAVAVTLPATVKDIGILLRSITDATYGMGSSSL